VPSGVGSYVFDLANNLATKLEVTVITGNFGKNDFYEHINENMQIYRLSTPPISPKFVWFQLKNSGKIKEILEKDKIDILHGQGTACALFFRDSVFKKSKVVTHHGDPRLDFIQYYTCPIRHKISKEFLDYGIAYPLWYFLSKHEYVHADKVITFSHFIAKNLQKTFGLQKDVAVIPQGIDVNKILAIIHKEKIEKDNSIFFSGRLIWRKGVIFLLKAFKCVHAEIPDLKLKMFGEGPLKGFIRSFIKRNKLERNIFLHSYVSYPSLIKEICKSYFAVLPSLFEAASIMMLEVMACKRAFISFNLPFTREYFVHMRNAYLTSVDEKELANAIMELYWDKCLREKLGENAYQYVMYYHNWSKLVDEYIRIYENLVG
jgi:glycosyltransferase involved in cell wall biosynthesis